MIKKNIENTANNGKKFMVNSVIWKNTPVTSHGYYCLSWMNRREIKNRIAFQIWTAVPGEERYKIGAVGQILETISFIPFRDDSIMSGQ